MKEIDTLLLKLVSGVELFREMDVDSVSALLRQASSMSFVPGDLVFEEGAEGHAMYIVTQGAFEVFRTSGGKHLRIAKVEAGQHFGEIALVANRTRSASVRALVPSVAIRLSKAAVMSEQKAAVLLFRNMAQMLAKCLITLYASGLPFSTQYTLASLAGAAPEFLALCTVPAGMMNASPGL